ncbi:hypothetical protein LTR65_010827 [Meristemomyces frigidus]
MPLHGDQSHHCKECGKTTAEKSDAGGFCDKHHKTCPIHTHWYMYKKESCSECDSDATRDINKERKEKEKKAKEVKEEQENAFFKESGKERKPRTKKK